MYLFHSVQVLVRSLHDSRVDDSDLEFTSGSCRAASWSSSSRSDESGDLSGNIGGRGGQKGQNSDRILHYFRYLMITNVDMCCVCMYYATEALFFLSTEINQMDFLFLWIRSGEIRSKTKVGSSYSSWRRASRAV